MFRTLDSELNRSRRANSSLALIVFDLDDFRCLNEIEGYPIGNILLRSIAQQLRSRCRNYDTVSRVAGDEFSLLLPDITNFLRFGEKTWVDALLQASCSEVGCQVLSASVGQAVFPDDGETAEELLAVAGRRMHLSKRFHHEAVAREAATSGQRGEKARMAA